jgi:hypothetical protein
VTTDDFKTWYPPPAGVDLKTWHWHPTRGWVERRNGTAYMAKKRREKQAEHDRAVVAVMNEQGFTSYAAAEAWLERRSPEC